MSDLIPERKGQQMRVSRWRTSMWTIWLAALVGFSVFGYAAVEAGVLVFIGAVGFLLAVIASVVIVGERIDAKAVIESGEDDLRKDEDE